MSADYEPLECGPVVSDARAEVFRLARSVWHTRLGEDRTDALVAAQFARSVDGLVVAAWSEPRPERESAQ